MADDVKVKFGGDFSEVSKGASEATAKAGGALGSWFNDFNKSTIASITSAMALAAVFGKLTENLSQTLKTAKGIDEAFKRFGTGKNSQEFQQIARYGAEVGVSMESVGRTMNYFAKVSDAASKGSREHRQALIGLKFTEDEVNKGKISAIEVLRRMADEYDRTGLEALAGSRAIQLFGMQGEQLSAIYKNGKINLDEFTKAIKGMSDATVENLAKTERRIEAFKRRLSEISGIVMGQIGKEGSENLGGLTAIEAMSQVGEMGGTNEQEGRSIGAQIYSEVKGDEDAIREAIEVLKDYEPDDWFADMDKVAAAQEAIKTIMLLQKRDSEKPDTGDDGPPLRTFIKTMAASSLQEIGGGDVNSVLSGTYQTSMLDAAVKTADNTGKLVQGSSHGAPPPKPINIAK